MKTWTYLPPIDAMERITKQQFCDDMDRILERVDKENVGFVIKNDAGDDHLILCPAKWFHYCFDDDFGCIINSALRYAISRHTYMPGVVIDFVRKYINIIDAKTISVAIKDIERAIVEDGVDDVCAWQQLNADLKARLEQLESCPKSNLRIDE